MGILAIKWQVLVMLGLLVLATFVVVTTLDDALGVRHHFQTVPWWKRCIRNAVFVIAGILLALLVRL